MSPLTYPTPGQPIPRAGKPYIWVTWLAKLLADDCACVWAAWFRAHYQHAKFEEESRELAAWNREHVAFMREVRTLLEENGWTCRAEKQNAFSLEGTVAIVAGQPDLIGTMPGHALLIDGKTGRPKASDWWQVVLYLFALDLQRKAGLITLEGDLRAQVAYKGRPDLSVDVSLRDVTPDVREAILSTIHRVAQPEPPMRTPTRNECRRCNIGRLDCPERVEKDPARSPVGVW
jgi:PD-(D/E)XK nuclease superfamily